MATRVGSFRATANGPLVADPARTVRCKACGFAADSLAGSDLDALDEIALIHDRSHASALEVVWSKSNVPSAPPVCEPSK